MKFKTKPLAFAVSTAVILFPLMSGSASAANYAPWLKQIGISDSVVSAAYWGKDRILGVVDTGIVANSPVFAIGQVSTALSSCAAVTFKCANGAVDDNSHGTAVAEIAAGNKAFAYNSNYGGYAVSANSVISVASNANIVAEKVLNAKGSGYSIDLASGVRKAADAGAQVINLSLSYGNTADVVSAINYATSKGAFIVWAGGNSTQALMGGANTLGLTPTAISHLVLVGSVNAKNVVSTFSNTPGSGALLDSNSAKTLYSSRWLMAPGEAILAPVATSGANAWGYWTGTSMSTPLVSGSLLLLQSAWPILKTYGTAANLLLATASDLGTRGVDSIYGNGIVNLSTAFQPYGALMVRQADGKPVAVSSLNSSLISSGALGNLSVIQKTLSNYMAFDGYMRNFSVNLSGLIQTPSTAALVNPLPSHTNTGPTVMKLLDGSEMAFMQASVANPAETLGLFGVNAEAPLDKRVGYAMLTDKAGTTTAIGYGYPVQFSYAKVLYGNDDLARLSSQLGVSNLSGLAQGGGLFAYGMRLNENTRIAISWSGTARVIDGTSASWNPAWANAKASNLGFGVTHKFSDQLTGGVNVGVLNESHGVLGSIYDASSALSLGESNRTMSLGLSTGFNITRNSSLLFEAGFAMTKEGNATGLLAGTTDLQSRSYGMTFMSKHLFKDEDRLTVSLVQPLRVVSGQVAVVMPSVDSEGIASFNKEWVSLVPTGRESDYKLSYDMPLKKNQSLSFQTSARKDVLNTAGNNDASAGVSWSMKF